MRPTMADGPGLDWLAQRLSGARRDAARIADELVSRGHLSAEQAAALQDAVGAAVDQGRELLAAALREPRRVAAVLRESAGRARRAGSPGGEERIAPPDGDEGGDPIAAASLPSDLLTRLARLEARLDLVERALERGLGGAVADLAPEKS